MTTSGRSLLIHAALATARLVTRNHLAAISDRMEQCTTAPVPGIVVGHVEETTAIFRRRRKSTRRHGISQSRQSLTSSRGDDELKPPLGWLQTV